MRTLLAIAITMTPVMGTAMLLWLAERIRLRREQRYARQIALTDAIHRELGAVAAPMVKRRLGGGWLVGMVVPLDRPALVAEILGVTERALAAGGDPFQIVLTPAPPGPRADRLLTGDRPIGRRALATVN